MSKVILKEQKKFDTNSEPLLEITWERTLCLENIQRINRCNSIIGRDKNCLLSELVNYNQDSVKHDRSFSMKSVEMEFYSCLRIESYLRDS